MIWPGGHHETVVVATVSPSSKVPKLTMIRRAMQPVCGIIIIIIIIIRMMCHNTIHRLQQFSEGRALDSAKNKMLQVWLQAFFWREHTHQRLRISPQDTEHSLNTLRHACIMDGQGQAGNQKTVPLSHRYCHFD